MRHRLNCLCRPPAGCQAADQAPKLNIPTGMPIKTKDGRGARLQQGATLEMAMPLRVLKDSILPPPTELLLPSIHHWATEEDENENGAAGAADVEALARQVNALGSKMAASNYTAYGPAYVRRLSFAQPLPSA